MKKLFFALFMTAALSTTLLAQDRPQRGGGQQRGDMSEMIAEKLSLDDDQKADLKEIFAAEQESMKEMRDSGASRDEMKEKMDALKTEQSAKIKDALGDSKYEEYEALMEEMKEKGPRGGGRGEK